jgi:hypothetical protein
MIYEIKKEKEKQLLLKIKIPKIKEMNRRKRRKG